MAPEEDCLADISGFLHGFNKISYPAVRTWIFDDRIRGVYGGEIKWTAVVPGRRGDWTKEKSITDIHAACNGNTRHMASWEGKRSATNGSMESWEGKSWATVDKGGRPRKSRALPFSQHIINGAQFHCQPLQSLLVIGQFIQVCFRHIKKLHGLLDKSSSR